MTIVSSPVEAGTVSAASRRTLLAGVLGGIGAWMLTGARRATPVRAADGENIQTGGEYTSTSVTKITNGTNGDTVFWAASDGAGDGVRAISDSGIGAFANSTSGYGVSGTSASNVGVRGTSTSHVALYGLSQSATQPASLGWAYGNNTGVQGHSGSGSPPGAKPKTGVFGYANQDNTAKGVWGQSPGGRAVMGSSSTGWAGYFSGRVYTERYQEFKEIGNPSAPGSNKARVFVRDNGSGKTQLCVRFSSGAVQVLATQP